MIYNSKLQWNDITLYIVADEVALLSLGFEEPDRVIWEENEVILRCKKQLQEYFNGKLRYFDLPIKLEGTDFQKLVWTKLMEIPYGKTVSYGEVAAAMDKPNAIRAVGMACNRNPLAIIIPCHRVIGKNKKLIGYAGGLNVKKQLLELERMP